MLAGHVPGTLRQEWRHTGELLSAVLSADGVSALTIALGYEWVIALGSGVASEVASEVTNGSTDSMAAGGSFAEVL